MGYRRRFRQGPDTNGHRRVLRQHDAAAYSGLAESTLEKYRLIGGGPVFIRLGARAVGYAVDDLDAWIDSRRRTSTSDAGPATT